MKMFSKKLSAALRDADLSQSAFAEIIGITGAALSYYVKDKRKPNFDIVRLMEEKLKLPIGYLMHDEIIPIDVFKKVPILFCHQNVDNFLNHGIIPADIDFMYIFFNENEKEINGMEKVFAMKIIGDAMASADKDSLHDGDIVTVCPQSSIKNGILIAACVENQLKVRKYLIDGDDVFLQASNTKLPAIKLNSSIKIYGVITQVNRKI